MHITTRPTKMIIRYIEPLINLFVNVVIASAYLLWGFGLLFRFYLWFLWLKVLMLLCRINQFHKWKGHFSPLDDGSGRLRLLREEHRLCCQDGERYLRMVRLMWWGCFSSHAKVGLCSQTEMECVAIWTLQIPKVVT